MPTTVLWWLALELTMWYAPKVATVIDELFRPTLRRGFGGPLRFAASVVAETMFWLMLSPIMWVCHTLFFLGLPIGRVVGWGVQERDDHSIGWSTAFAKLWPQMLLGVAGLAVVALTHPAALPWMFIPRGRRARARRAALRRHLRAGCRADAAADRHRPPARGDRTAGRAQPARAAPRGGRLSMLRTAFGVVRLLGLYYGHPAWARAMDRLYAQFQRRPG